MRSSMEGSVSIRRWPSVSFHRRRGRSLCPPLARRHRRLLYEPGRFPMRRALIAAMLLGGCVPELAVRGEAKIQCEADDSCPQGFSCRTSLGRCIGDDVETEPPALASAD